MQAARVDPAHAARHDHRARRRPQTSGYSSSRVSAVCCFESFRRAERAAIGERQPLQVEQDRRGHERPGERSAPGLVGPRHVAAAEIAVEREQASPLSAAALAASCVACGGSPSRGVSTAVPTRWAHGGSAAEPGWVLEQPIRPGGQ